jgi:hypothetical protein
MAKSGFGRKGCGCLGIGSFGIGTIIAIVISWTTWHNVLWTILHAFLSWAFIIWYAIFY